MQSGVSFSGLFTEGDTSRASINADGNGAKTAATSVADRQFRLYLIGGKAETL